MCPIDGYPVHQGAIAPVKTCSKACYGGDVFSPLALSGLVAR